MAAKRTLKGDISEAMHSSAAMLHKVGALDKATMRDFDARHLAVPDAIEPTRIEQLARQSFATADLTAAEVEAIAKGRMSAEPDSLHSFVEINGV